MRHVVTAVIAILALNACAPASNSSPSSATTTALANNVIPIVMNEDYKYPNLPFVTITVCIPGTTSCQTIPHILLDTGSSGLRINASALQLNLPNVTDSSQRQIAECVLFGSGKSWGPLATVDLTLGGDQASALPMQIINANFSTVPSLCSGASQSAFVGNGILGVGLDVNVGSNVDQSLLSAGQLFSCTSTSCSPEVDSANSLQSKIPDSNNPVSRLATDNNGVIIQLPNVPIDGSTAVTGTLTLGIDTQSNNAAPANLHVIKINPTTGFFNVAFEGSTYNGLIDSGSIGWGLPVSAGLPACGTSGAAAQLFCPTTTASLSATLTGFNSSTATPITFQIVSAEDLSYEDNDLGYLNSGSGYVSLGITFFFGKTVYYGLKGRSSSLGAGPLNAF